MCLLWNCWSLNCSLFCWRLIDSNCIGNWVLISCRDYQWGQDRISRKVAMLMINWNTYSYIRQRFIDAMQICSLQGKSQLIDETGISCLYVAVFPSIVPAIFFFFFSETARKSLWNSVYPSKLIVFYYSLD